MYLKELTNEEFDGFTNTYFQSSVYQTKEYAFVMNKQGFDSIFLGLIDDSGHTIAATLLLIQKKFGFKYAYAPRGFLLDYTSYPTFEAFTICLKKYLGKKDVIAVKLCPMIVKSIYNEKGILLGNNRNYDTLFTNFKKLGYYHLGYNNHFESFKPRFESIIDLTKPVPEIFKHFKRGTKNKVRSSLAKGVGIHRGTIDDIQELYLEVKEKYARNLTYFDDCYQNFEKTGNVDFYYAKLDTEIFLTITKKRYEIQESFNTQLNNIVLNRNVQKKSFYINKKIEADTQFEMFKNRLIEATSLLRDSPEGIVIATALILKQKDTVYLFMDGYDEKFKSFSGKHVLIWSLIQKYAKEGYKYFNLGGMTNVTLDDNPFKGLNDFKSGFGGNTYEYIGDFELVTNQALYFMYKNAAPLRSIFKR